MRIALLSLVAACGSPPVVADPVRLQQLTAELSPALQPLQWLVGDWSAGDGEREQHWVPAAGAMYGVAFQFRDSFDVHIIDDSNGGGKADGVIRLFTPGELRVLTTTPDTIVFANESRDVKIHYALSHDVLRHHLETKVFSDSPDEMKRMPYVSAPELEQADRAFSDATGARGVDGWVEAFDDDGVMVRRGKEIKGHAAIAEAMKPLLASGKLAWAPIASGKRGDLGYTVGKAEFRGTEPADHWRSSYVTIWRHRADGWKVVFDTGRPVNE